MPEGKLLEELAAEADCYISSLRDEAERKRVYRILLEFDSKRYRLKEWEYCISYLTGEPVLFSDYDEVRRFLENSVL